MFLARSLTDAGGTRYPMAGLLPVDVRVFDRRRALGYVEVETRRDSILGGSNDAPARALVEACGRGRAG